MSLNNSKKKRHMIKTASTTTKRRKYGEKEKMDDVSFDNVNEEGTSSDSDAEQTSLVNRSVIPPSRSSSAGVPSFVGRLVTPVDTDPAPRTSTSSTCRQILETLSKLESQCLRSLLVSQERCETMLKNLYKNQLKIQKTLRKQKVVVAF